MPGFSHGALVVEAHTAMLGSIVAGMAAGMWLGEAILGVRPWSEDNVPV